MEKLYDELIAMKLNSARITRMTMATTNSAQNKDLALEPNSSPLISSPRTVPLPPAVTTAKAPLVILPGFS